MNEERAKQLSQPRVDAQGKPIKPEPPRRVRPGPTDQAAAAPVASALRRANRRAAKVTRIRSSR